ncbi:MULTISPECIES: FAD-dependent oxidoreductase [unclassified Curtobacterium]|jgi:FAD/FMN-containing dehydrogenase|uniref:FAD-binding oxidoreductase n=1 Tax=unclassified Curtobacterium TaxID=257496 RepID=UPI003017D48B
MDIVRPSDTGYAALQHVYSSTGRPGSILLPRTTTEVAEALAIVRASGRPFAVRSGGHGISSIATNTGGDVIDLRALASVEPRGGRSVRVGPGARWGAVAWALAPHGLAISSGDSGDVGVGGLATTGGIGLMGRAHGLTIDRLRGAEIVTADGTARRVSGDEEPDLFWAIRGAGANFGIVTAFDFEASETADVVQTTAVYQPIDLAAFLQAWGRTVETAARPVSAFLYLGAGPTPFAQATIVYAGDDLAAAAPEIERFLRIPGLAGQRAAVTPYAAVPLTSGAPHTGQQRAATHTGLAVHLDQDLSDRIAVLLRSAGVDMVQIRSVGGAINDVDPAATAYAHRHQNFSVTAVSVRGGDAFHDAWESVHPRMDGMYLSFETDHAPSAVAEAFPPATLARLRDLKARWDPDDLFDQNFDVSRTSAELS